MNFDWLYQNRGERIQCELCPKACLMGRGERGDCRIRLNLDGQLRALTYGLPSAVHVDPVEKKPLYHFRPGRPIFSVATAGCNLHCLNCQNWSLSQTDPEDMDNSPLPPEAIPLICRRERIEMVAFTYSEPLTFYEYTLDSFERCRAAGLQTVLKSAGYANPGPLRRLYRATSAANIDLKAFSESFYRDVCAASLKPVLNSLVLAREAGVWLEVTTLVIPTLSDSEEEFTRMVRWMLGNLGPGTPLHLSRFHPEHKLKNLPPTPAETLTRFADAARDEGLRYVYVGNLPGAPQNTLCPRCGELLVERRGFGVLRQALAATNGNCPRCGEAIPGVWT